MIRLPPVSTLTDTRLPSTALVQSVLLVVDDRQQPRAHARTGFGDGVEVHCQIQMLGHQKIGRGTARQPALELIAVLHATAVIFENLTRTGDDRPLDHAASL